MENVMQLYGENGNSRNHVRNLGEDGRMILK
jgi:hypothetical protein